MSYHWSVIVLVSGALVGGIFLGQLTSRPGAPAMVAPADAVPTGAGGPEAGGPEAGGKLRQGHTYDGSEWERVRDGDQLDFIDKITLMMRQKQPIYFLGLPMRQIPTDNWLMSELIYQVKPDYVIETGTLYGGSAVYYAGLLKLADTDAKVITVDINEEQIEPAAKAHPLWAERVQFIQGSSTDEAVIRQIRDEVGEGKKVLITLDTLHAPDHVSKELELYSQFVSRGSYLILQDTYYEGLREVLDEFLDQHEEFRRDPTPDQRFVFTKYRGGFLQRIM